MENLRFIRISIPGWMLLLTIFILCFNSQSNCALFNLLEFSEEKELIALLTIFLASPLFGIIITTITYSFIHIIFGYAFYFPRNGWDENYSKSLFQALDKIYQTENMRLKVYELKEKLHQKPSVFKFEDRINMRELFDLYQILIRKKMKTPVFEYTEKAWNFFYLNANNLSAIVIGAIIALFWNKKACFSGLNVFIVLLTIYIASSIWHLVKCRRDAIKLERNWIESLK